MKVVVPAAGLGTRFAKERLGVPKELVLLGGKPVIWHALAEAARAGFDAAVVVLSPAKHLLAQFLSVTDRPLPIETVVQASPLGVGDAVLRCWTGEPIGVLLPDDVVLETGHWTQLLGLHGESGAPGLCVREVPPDTTSRFGIAECSGDKLVSLVEKPPRGTARSNLAVFGRYVVTDSVVAGLRASKGPGELELTHGFTAAIDKAPGVGVVRFEGEIYDCGTPEEYASSISRFPA
jgi:UTP--glucose-1-phosphate uridylyltransferase